MFLLNLQNEASNFIGNLAVTKLEDNSSVFIVWSFNEKSNSVTLVELPPYISDVVLVLEIELIHHNVFILDPVDIPKRILQKVNIDIN
jgi:hypothetical protein